MIYLDRHVLTHIFGPLLREIYPIFLEPVYLLFLQMNCLEYFRKDYEIGNQIGKGAFGVVYKG
jgi:hypothetical protein